MNATPPEPKKDAAPGNSVWNSLGPFYDEARVRAMLGDRFAPAGLLVVVTGDGARAYPTWQFDAAGRPLPHLAEVLSALRSGGEDAVGEALWLKAPSTAFAGRTAAELLGAGEFLTVLAEANRDAARWSH